MTMDEIRCIAVDDEPLALEQIVRYIGRIESLRLTGAFLNPEKALEAMRRQPVDLLFLDIEMPSVGGVELARTVNEEMHSVAVVFTTAYPQYAVEGFRVDAVDYLLKPLSFESMLTAVEKVKRRMAQPQGEADRTLYVKSGGSLRRIHADEVVFVKGLSEYVQICVVGDSKLITTHESLKRLETLLPADKFMRVHKSYIVNLAFMETTDYDTVTLSGHAIPIGQKYRHDFKQRVKTL